MQTKHKRHEQNNKNTWNNNIRCNSIKNNNKSDSVNNYNINVHARKYYLGILAANFKSREPEAAF